MSYIKSADFLLSLESLLVRAESDRNGINADVVPIIKVSDIEETRVVPIYVYTEYFVCT